MVQVEVAQEVLDICRAPAGNGPNSSPYGNGGGGGGGAGAAGGPALDGGGSGGGGGGIGSFVSPDFAGSNGTTGPVSARYVSCW